MSEAFALDLDELTPDMQPDSIVSRTLFDDEQLKVVLFSFAVGQELSEHTASMAAILHFLSGEASLTLGNEEREAHADTWVHMPPRLPHSIKAMTQVHMLLMLIKR